MGARCRYFVAFTCLSHHLCVTGLMYKMRYIGTPVTRVSLAHLVSAFD